MDFKYKYNDLQRKWLDDLKTTTEPQTTHYLHILSEKYGLMPGFCCLGRACVVAEWPAEPTEFRMCYDQVDNEALPEELARQLWLRSTTGAFKQPIKLGDLEYARGLTHLNDDFRWTFKQIAEYIEANPDNVFADYEEQKKEWIAKQNEAAGNDLISFTRLDSKPEPGVVPK